MASHDIDALRMVASGNLGGNHEHLDKFLGKQRERDIKDWIQDNVDLTVYEHSALAPEKVAELLESLNEELAFGGQNLDPVDILKDKLFDYLENAYMDWQLKVQDECADSLAKTFNMSIDEARDWIFENAEPRYPMNQYLSDSYRTVIMIDTGDSNYDFTLNSIDPCFDGDPIEDLNDEASIVWLAEQNGYSKEAFVHFMQNIDALSKEEHPFIHSVYENLENTSTSINGLVFIGTMSLADLAKAQRDGVTIPKCTRCGFYDGWNGAGSPFDIELQRDIIIPANVIFSVLPDCNYRLRFSVNETYDFTNKMWDTPFFAGVAKEFEPEQIEQAKALCASPPRLFAEEGSPSCFIEKKFATAFRHNVERLGGIYDGMLNRGQFTRAAEAALDRVSIETTGLGRQEYQFSETYFRDLQQLAPCGFSQNKINEYLTRFDMSRCR